MYPDLSYLLHDLFGTERDNWTAIFKTYGLFLVLAIATAALLLYLELKRRAKAGQFQPSVVKKKEGLPASAGELIGNAVFGFILGFKGLYIARHFGELQADPAGVLLSGKGDWLWGLAGAALFAGLKYWEGQRRKLPKPVVKQKEIYPHDRIGDITLIAALSGVVGAKIFDVVEHIDQLMEEPMKVLFSGAGLAIYGGLIGGFIGVGLYLRRHRIPFIYVLDSVAAPLMIAYGIGRMGCHLSGDGDWGVPAAEQPDWWFLPDWLWAYDYPHNVLDKGEPIAGCAAEYCSHLVPAVYPTSVYEFVMALAIGGLLWSLRKPLQTLPGMLFFLYLTLNGVERFFIEKIRVNQRYDFLGINPTQAEVIATMLFLIGLTGMIVIWRRRR